MRLKEHTDELLKQGKIDLAIQELTALLENDFSKIRNIPNLETVARDEIHYLLGNTYYKKGEWKEAIQHYQEACEYNAESPARERLKMTYSILEFYNKDIYGQ